MNKLDLWTCSRNGTRSYVGDLLWYQILNETILWLDFFMNVCHLRCPLSLELLCQLPLGLPLSMHVPSRCPLSAPLFIAPSSLLCTSLCFHGFSSFCLSFQGQLSCPSSWLPAHPLHDIKHLHICRSEPPSASFSCSSHKSDLYNDSWPGPWVYVGTSTVRTTSEVGWQASEFSLKTRERRVGFLFSRVVLNFSSHVH